MNSLFADRTKLKPDLSVKKIIQYALLEDAKSRSRFQRNSKASIFLSLLLVTYPAYYVTKGIIYGCWNDMQEDLRVRLIFQPQGLIYRSFYRPEIYLRDQSAELYRIEKENIEKEKTGERPSASSPLVLWH